MVKERHTILQQLRSVHVASFGVAHEQYLGLLIYVCFATS